MTLNLNNVQNYYDDDNNAKYIMEERMKELEDRQELITRSLDELEEKLHYKSETL